jgi:ferric-dicitrate binding protein FerR (iron transport regulator)
MSPGETRLAYLFTQYLDNACSAAELEELLAIIDGQKNKTVLQDQLRLLWQNSHSAPVEEVDWDGLYSRMMATAGHPGYTLQKQRRISHRILAAAAVILACAIAVPVYRANRQQGSSTMITKEKPVNKKDKPAGHQLINLPDGSMALLNTNSKLDYPPSFKGKTREVYLTGEAYFDIKHNGRQPFLVHAGNITTRVLGTAFNVKAYPGENTIFITVTKGKVEVTNRGNTLGIITRNQQIAIDKLTQKHRQQAVNAEETAAWKKDDLIMEDITFDKAARLIEQKYHVEIKFENQKLMACRFTATFLDSTSLEQVLAVLCDLNNAAFSRQDVNNGYIISGRGCDE